MPERPIFVDGVARLMFPRPADGPFDLLDSSFDNLGNSIHAEAPFSFWDDGSRQVVDLRSVRFQEGWSFDQAIDFVNECDGMLVLSAANFIQFDGDSTARRTSYARLQSSLERLAGPLVVLGMGVQSPRGWDAFAHPLPSEAVSLMQFLGDKCELISVRGDLSASVFRDYAGVDNVFVTGCPSFFQRPQAFRELRSGGVGARGLVSTSFTHFSLMVEGGLMRKAFRAGYEWIDVRYPFFTNLGLSGVGGSDRAELPVDLKVMSESGEDPLSAGDVRRYLQNHRRTFHGYHDWVAFNQRHVRFSWGTRLHVNMATLLAGKPALWIVHDSRTIEACNALRLPTVYLGDVQGMEVSEFEDVCNFDEMFDSLALLFTRFNEFCDAVSLPRIERPA